MINTTVEMSLLILTIELSLLAVGITYYTFRGARRVEAESNSQATELVSKVSATADVRRTALEIVFREKYQIEDAALQTTVDEFIEREKAFYNAVVGAFLGRGDHKISDLNDELTKVVAPWISITPNNLVDTAVVDSIAAEKTQVEAELDDTKKVLGKMMDEYSRAFGLPSGPTSAGDSAADGDTASVEADEGLLSISLDDDESEELVTTDRAASSGESVANEEPLDGSDASPEIESLDLDEMAELTEDAEFATEVTASETQTDAEVGEQSDRAGEVGHQSSAESSLEESEQTMSAEDLDELIDGMASEPSDELETV
ncbi:MAG: hypothetical protein ACI9BW_001072 [Gammaproteobacteria bacterium]|jgi:hypothetical protein